jgi:ribosome-associated protein
VLHVNEQITIPDSEFTFTYSRSSGPGGQNVNKVSSRATMHWNVRDSQSLPPAIRQRFIERFRNRITVEGAVVIHSQRHRDQLRNAQDCLSRLQTMILSVEKPPTPRKKTRPSRGANQRRLKDKKQRSERKQNRRRPQMGD